MKQFLTLGNKLNYSFTALLKFIVANIWKFIIWTFTVFLLPAYQYVGVIIFLLIADMITGIWKAIKNGEPVTAELIGKTITRMILWNVGILCSFLVQSVITSNAIPIMLIFSMLICVREFKSIIENIEAITNTKIWEYIVTQITTILPNHKDLDDHK